MKTIQSPIKFLILIILTIFLSETIIMLFIPSLPRFPLLPEALSKALFDSILLIFILFPVLYFLIFRPSRTSIIELIKINRQLETQMAERNKTEEALHQERNKLKGILDTMNDGVYIVNPQNDIEYVNPVIEKEFGLVNGRKCYDYLNDRHEVCPWCKNEEVLSRKSLLWEWHSSKINKTYELGFSQEELIGRPVAEFLDERNQKICKEQVALRKKWKADSYEISWTNKDGQKIPTIVSPKPIFDRDGYYKGCFAIITDISERKHAEGVLRHLSSQLLTIQEQERKRISGELHDELGQSLALLKIQQGFIEKSLPEDQVELKEKCKQNVTYVDQIVENLRRISRDLSPYVLEYLGLTAALRRLIIDFTKNYSIEVASDVMDIDPLIKKENRIIIYRIFQEALNNIRKHAHTVKASVAIRQNDNRISFSIEDDGKGFDVEEMLIRNPATKGLGLTIIGERVRMLGGALDLWSQEGKGTRISFTIPKEKGPV